MSAISVSASKLVVGCNAQEMPDLQSLWNLHDGRIVHLDSDAWVLQ